MNLSEKIKEILSIQQAQTAEKYGSFNNPALNEEILKIEELIEETLPSEFKQLYSFTDGQDSDGKGIFFGDKFMSTEEIINQLKESRKFLKPVIRTIEHPEKSDELIKEIVKFYLSKAPKSKLFGLKPSWYKMKFSCAPNAFSGPYLYKNDSTASEDYMILEINSKEYREIEPVIQELDNLEGQSYNWDELHFTIYQNGKYEVSRDDYNSLYDESLYSSSPENAIKRKYFHYKWVPVFSDYSGNYIGIDMDPDIKGKRGQIINFGRDEDSMTVLANSLEEFFDFVLLHLQNPESNLLNLKFHIHDTLRKIKAPE